MAGNECDVVSGVGQGGMEALGELREVLDKCLPLAAYVGSLVRREPLTSREHAAMLGTLLKIQLLSTKLVIANTYRLISSGVVQLSTAESSTDPLTDSMKLTNTSDNLDPIQVASAVTNMATGTLKGVVKGIPSTCIAASKLAANTSWEASKMAASTSWAVVAGTTRMLRGRGRREPEAQPSFLDPAVKRVFVNRLLRAKNASGRTFAEIADMCGVTNVYCAQLFYGQAQLKPETTPRLRKAVNQLTDADIAEMSRAPMRSYDPRILQEPNVARLQEVVMHYGESLKAIINEEFGDGVIDTADLYVTLDRVKGQKGEDRVLITFNGQFLPHVEQRLDEMSSNLNPLSSAKS